MSDYESSKVSIVANKLNTFDKTVKINSPVAASTLASAAVTIAVAKQQQQKNNIVTVALKSPSNDETVPRNSKIREIQKSLVNGIGANQKAPSQIPVSQ